MMDIQNEKTGNKTVHMQGDMILHMTKGQVDYI